MEHEARDENVDYRKMYYHLAAATEKAIRLLIEAQQTCEDILLESDTLRGDALDE